MPTKRIGDLPIAKPCNDLDHKPAGHVIRPSGVYEHVCPTCGQTFTFVVPKGPNWFADKLGKKNVIITPTGGAWIVDDLDLAEWACDILNVGEIR